MNMSLYCGWSPEGYSLLAGRACASLIVPRLKEKAE